MKLQTVGPLFWLPFCNSLPSYYEVFGGPKPASLKRQPTHPPAWDLSEAHTKSFFDDDGDGYSTVYESVDEFGFATMEHEAMFFDQEHDDGSVMIDAEGNYEEAFDLGAFQYDDEHSHGDYDEGDDHSDLVHYDDYSEDDEEQYQSEPVDGNLNEGWAYEMNEGWAFEMESDDGTLIYGTNPLEEYDEHGDEPEFRFDQRKDWYDNDDLPEDQEIDSFSNSTKMLLSEAEETLDEDEERDDGPLLYGTNPLEEDNEHDDGTLLYGTNPLDPPDEDQLEFPDLHAYQPELPDLDAYTVRVSVPAISMPTQLV